METPKIFQLQNMGEKLASLQGIGAKKLADDKLSAVCVLRVCEGAKIHIMSQLPVRKLIVASDALGSALAEQAADAAEAELRQWAAKEGKYLTGRFSPGYGDWDIAVQPLVANALDTVRRAGLCVTDTNLMTPRKSVTAILGVSGHPVKGKLAGCGHCVLRTRCEYRKRGKTCASE